MILFLKNNLIKNVTENLKTKLISIDYIIIHYIKNSII